MAIEWTEKYRPQTLSDIAGHKKPLEDLKAWAQSWKCGIPESKAVVLYGKPGTGKTSAAYAVARDMGWEIIELNASDQRTADIIEKVAGSASRMSTLDGSSTKRLILLDEADNIHGTADRGGEKAIVELIKKTSHPIILIANELYDMSAGLRGICKPVQFNSVISRSIIPALKKIVDAEGIKYGQGVLEKIADNAHGDLRSAINDLQAIAQGKTSIYIADVITGERDSKENIFKVLIKIFKSKNMREAYESTFTLDENPEDLVQWIDENLPLEFAAPAVLGRGYHYLGRASIFLGRVKRRQNYNMWRYAGLLMSGGITTAKSNHHSGFVKYQPPSLWKKLGHTKGMRSVRDSTAGKIGAHCHVSMSFTRFALMPFFRFIMNDEKYAAEICALIGFEPEEIAFLTGSKSVSKKVNRIHETAITLLKEETERQVRLAGGFGDMEKKDQISMHKKEESHIPVKKERRKQRSLFDY